jgi:hypothetical protein
MESVTKRRLDGRLVARPETDGGLGRSFPERGQQMRVDRNGGEVKRQALAALDDARLAKVKGGLKAERIQGVDPPPDSGGG